MIVHIISTGVIWTACRLLCMIYHSMHKVDIALVKYVVRIWLQLTFSRQISVSYTNQFNDLLYKSTDWFLYVRSLCHERVNYNQIHWSSFSIQHNCLMSKLNTIQSFVSVEAKFHIKKLFLIRKNLNLQTMYLYLLSHIFFIFIIISLLL